MYGSTVIKSGEDVTCETCRNCFLILFVQDCCSYRLLTLPTETSRQFAQETTEGPCPGNAMSEEAMTVVSASCLCQKFFDRQGSLREGNPPSCKNTLVN